MSRTIRCAPFVEAALYWLHVAPGRNGGFVATLAVEPPPGPWHRLPLLVTGEGETVARAVGAAEAAGAKALKAAAGEEKAKRKRDRKQVGLFDGSEEEREV